MSNFQFLDYQVEDKVAIITLASPDEVNTLSVASVKEWIGAIELANADENVGAILFTSGSKMFSAGADMKTLFLPKASGEEPYVDSDNFTGGLDLFSTDCVTLIRESKPVITAVNGHAVGAGITFFLASDVLIASDRANLHFSFVKLGLVPEICSTKYLPARVGFGRASEILLGGRTVAAAEAKEIGLVDYLFSHDEMLEEAKKIASNIASSPVPMLKMTKQLLDQNYLETDIPTVWKRESDCLRACFGMEEHKQAVAKFLKKS
ncbi:MAG: enoyl-CoA hydratase/isomerase family protein [bacterium]